MMTGIGHVANDGNSNVSKRQCMSLPEVEVQTTNMMDSSFALAVIKFKVNYEQIKHLDPDKAIKSDTISACGHIWRIGMYARGMNGKPDIGNEYVTILLEHLSKCRTRSINAIFEVLLIDKDGEQVLISYRRNQSLQKSFGNFGLFKFNSQTNNLASKYVKDGQIQFMCTITVLENSSIDVPPSNLGEHIGTLLGSRDGTDVSFIVDGETFHAHRFVLAARSSVFKAELLGSIAEATIMPSITLHDIAPATFKIMLQFMYTDALPGDDELGNSPTEMLRYLLAAADRYALDRMKLLCAQKLWDTVSVDTVATNIVCAERYSCPELKHKCIDFFTEEKNFVKAVLTDGFVELVQQFPSIIAEVRERIGTRNGGKHNVEHCSGSQA